MGSFHLQIRHLQCRLYQASFPHLHDNGPYVGRHWHPDQGIIQKVWFKFILLNSKIFWFKVSLKKMALALFQRWHTVGQIHKKCKKTSMMWLLCRLWAEIEAHKWRFLALLVDHILSEVRPVTKELSAVLSTPNQYWASF